MYVLIMISLKSMKVSFIEGSRPLGINQPESERVAYTMLFRYNMSMEALAGEVYLN